MRATGGPPGPLEVGLDGLQWGPLQGPHQGGENGGIKLPASPQDGKNGDSEWKILHVLIRPKFFFVGNAVYLYMTCVVLVCSNYDQWYHHRRYYVPTDSSTDPEDHPYSPEDPQALPG